MNGKFYRLGMGILGTALLLTAAFGWGVGHAQVPISNLPNANLPLQGTDQVIVNQLNGTSTRKATVSAFTSLAPPINASYILQSANALVPNSRVLVGTANEILLADGGPLGNLVLSTPQPIATTSSPTFAGLTLTNPLTAANGGTGFNTYSIGDILAANSSTTLVRVNDVAVGSYFRSGGVGTLPLWSTLTLPNAATTGDLLTATGTNAIGNLADVSVGSYLRSGGASTAPLWSTVKIPNTAVLGDIWYGSAANTISALAGNITTGPQFLAQTGTGAVSAAPVWTTLPGSFTGFANPTGVVGLTAVNGVATTAPRSDSSPALSQAIAPTWSAQHKYSQAFSSFGTAGNAPVFFISNAPGFSFDNSGQAADSKVWDFTASGLHLLINSTNDAGTVSRVVLDVLRSGAAVSTMTLGNLNDKPAISLDGPTQAYEPNFSAAALKNVATYETGSFTGTLTGMTATTQGTFIYTRIGNWVSLQGPAAGLTGTSNATSMSLTGLPASITPAGNPKVVCTGVVNSGVGDQLSQCFVLTTNQISITLFSGGTFNAPFTAAGLKGVTGGFTASYPLNN